MDRGYSGDFPAVWKATGGKRQVEELRKRRSEYFDANLEKEDRDKICTIAIGCLKVFSCFHHIFGVYRYKRKFVNVFLTLTTIAC